MVESQMQRVRPGPRRRWVWISASIVLLIAGYAAAGFLLLPRIAKSQIASYVEQNLKRRIAIEEITFNPFTFATEIRGFALTEADGAPIASFDRLAIDFLPSSLFSEAWTFRQVILDRPDVNVVINADGSLNLAKLQPQSAAGAPRPQAAAAPANTSISLPAIRIGAFAVNDGRLTLEDRSRRRPFSTTLTPIAFALNDFRTAQNFQSEYRFEGTTLAGERLSWSGRFSILPLGSEGRFIVGGVKSETIASYLQDALPFALASGSLDIDGQYRATLTDEMRLQLELPSVKLHDLGIAPRDGGNGPVWIAVPETTISGITVMLPERKVAVERIDIDGAKLSLWREPNGDPNLLKLLPAPATPSPAAQTGDAQSVSASVGTIQIRAASITAEDRTLRPAPKFAATQLDLSIAGWSTDPGHPFDVKASVTLNRKTRASSQGSVQVTPLAFNLAVDLANFDLTPLRPYIAPFTLVRLQSGQVSAKGKLALNPKPARGQPGFQYSGSVTVANLATQDPLLRQDFIKWQRLDLTGIDYRQGPDSLAIDRIRAVRPYGKIVFLPDQTLNVVAALTPPATSRPARATARATTQETPRPKAAVSRAAAPPRPMPVRIREIVLENGSTDFADLSIEPSFAAAIGGLGGTVTGISSAPASRAQVKLTGSVDRFAPVDISGQFNLFSAAAFSDIAMNFRNMELTEFNPYSGKYAGYNIAKGKLTTELHYTVENRKLDLKHHIVLDQLEFGGATDSKDAVPLPVRLAVALLKDRDGVIDVNFPVSGSMDDPEFQVGPLIWKAVLGLLTKIVSAPFDAIASLFDGGPDLSYVDFAPGSAALAADEGGRIEKLAMALAQRPELRLDIPLQTLSQADDAALAEAAFNQAVGEVVLPPPTRSLFQRRDEPATPEQQRLAILAELYQEQFGAPPMYPVASVPDSDPVKANVAFLESALRPRYAPNEVTRGQLAKARAIAVQEAILSHDGIMPERIFLTERSSGKTSPTVARMELRLQ